MPKNPSKARAEGMIRRRGNAFQAILFAGTDPVTGRQLYLRGSRIRRTAETYFDQC